MRKTKKILSVALASTMVLSLAACGGKSTTETTQAAAETTASSRSGSISTPSSTKLVFGFVVRNSHWLIPCQCSRDKR